MNFYDETATTAPPLSFYDRYPEHDPNNETWPDDQHYTIDPERDVDVDVLDDNATAPLDQLDSNCGCDGHGP